MKSAVRAVFPSISASLAIAGLILLILLTGCSGPKATSRPGVIREIETLYAQTAGDFPRADFWKPRENDSLPFSIYLSPLIYQEVSPLAAEGEAPDSFGAVEHEEGGRFRIDQRRPTVYYSTDTVRLLRKEYLQLTFWWYYPESPRPSVRYQGVRMTFGGHGFPVVFEVLSSKRAIQVVYVSERLEEKAREKFGLPLAGRRYCVEPGLDTEPRVAVVRVLEEGPVPMGPFVALRAGSHEVGDIHCRCRPSHARSLRYDLEFDLVEAGPLLEADFERTPLDRTLRLPPDL